MQCEWRQCHLWTGLATYLFVDSFEIIRKWKNDNHKFIAESMCFENGIHYNVGDSFRNGSFKLTCGRDGVAIEGTYQRLIFYLRLIKYKAIRRTKRFHCRLLSAERSHWNSRSRRVSNRWQIQTWMRESCRGEGPIHRQGSVPNLISYMLSFFCSQLCDLRNTSHNWQYLSGLTHIVSASRALSIEIQRSHLFVYPTFPYLYGSAIKRRLWDAFHWSSVLTIII